jgi:Flp pilus assembly protein TadD
VTSTRAAGLVSAAWMLVALDLLSAPKAARAAAPEPDAAAADLDVEIVVERDDDAALLSGAAADRGAKPGALSPEVAALRDEVVALHSKLAELDHYSLLGVARNADAGTIKRAYLKAAKRFHPDALLRLGLAELHAQSNELFARIGKAHAVLSDPAARRAYDDEAGGMEDAEAQRLAQAEGFFRKGEVLARKGAFAEALQFLAPAVELWPDDPAYRMELGWALYKQPRADAAAALPHLEAAVALEPGNSIAHYRLGVVLRALGRGADADRSLAKAKALEPKGKKL